MSGFDNFNTTVKPVGYAAPVVVNKPAAEAEYKVEMPSSEIEEKKLSASIMKGATALAVGAAAGIAIAKRGVIAKYMQRLSGENIHFNGGNSTLNLEDVLPKSRSFDVKQRDKEIFENERLKDIIREKYEKIADIAKDSVERQKERIQELVRPEDKPLLFTDRRLFTSHEAEMVASYQDEYAFNIPLRLGKIKPEKSIEIRTLDEMIEDTRPLPEKATVFRGIVVQKNGEPLEFAQNLKVGRVLSDKAFVSTSRNATETVAEFGEQDAYVMRINLPEGTKGIDCRRFTMLDLDTGANAEFILPRGSKFLINSIDDRTKIIDADYILQN